MGAFTFLGASSRARAQEQQAAVLTLDISACAHLSPDRLREILALELSTVGEGTDTRPVRVLVACFPKAVALRVEISPGGRLERHVEQAPRSMNERSVALAASEMVADLWATPAQRQETPNTEPSESRSPKQEEAVEIGTRSFLSAAVGARFHGAPQRLVPVVGLTYDFAVHPSFELGLNLAWSPSRVSTDVVVVQQTALSVAPQVHFVWAPSRAVDFRFGGAALFGWARMSPEAKVSDAEARSFSAFWLGGLAQTSARAKFSELFFGELQLGTGAVLVPVVGAVAGESALEISGFLGKMDLRIGFLF